MPPRASKRVNSQENQAKKGEVGKTDRMLRHTDHKGPASGSRKRSVESEDMIDGSNLLKARAQRPSKAVKANGGLNEHTTASQKGRGVASSGRLSLSMMQASLRLSTEDFLHLQAAAKSFMLDPNHQERQGCVGQRGSSDPDMTKIRMLKCAQSFLDDYGNGGRFFRKDSSQNAVTKRQLKWPEAKEKIVQLIIPLLRRIVTNERQRVYANETRHTDERKQTRQSEGPSPMSKDTPSANSVWDIDPSTYSLPESTSKDSIGTTGGLTPLDHTSVQHPSYLGGENPMIAQDPFGGALAVEQAVTSSDGEQYFPYNLSDDFSHYVIPDLFQDGMIPAPEDAAASYVQYNSQNDQRLDELHAESTLTDPEWFNIIAAVDGHFRLLHGKGNDCAPACEQAHLNMVAARFDPLVSQQKPQEDIDQSMEAIREAWDLVRHSTDLSEPTPGQQHPDTPVTLHVNVLEDGKRVMPHFLIYASNCPNLLVLKCKVIEALDSYSPVNIRVSTWLPGGMMACNDDVAWETALNHARTVEWMDNELKVIVDLDRLNVEGGQTPVLRPFH